MPPSDVARAPLPPPPNSRLRNVSTSDAPFGFPFANGDGIANLYAGALERLEHASTLELLLQVIDAFFAVWIGHRHHAFDTLSAHTVHARFGHFHAEALLHLWGEPVDADITVRFRLRWLGQLGDQRHNSVQQRGDAFIRDCRHAHNPPSRQ